MFYCSFLPELEKISTLNDNN
uniref:Uncharacterized protein n=1 Tax=Arundo donax TaxID=35708 RepID=A0A0A9F4W9_ARUDO